MNVKQLRDYTNWIGKSALMIKQDVMRTSGKWGSVFKTYSIDVKVAIPIPVTVYEIEKLVPPWANRIRNYFNESPQQLYRLTANDAKKAVKKLARPDIISRFALDSDPQVYKDKQNDLWFLMKVGGTVYHVGDGKPSKLDIAKAQFGDREDFPFKLVSPDGSGGSSEIIVLNPDKKSEIGSAGKWVDITDSLDRNPVTCGTYNYAETLSLGMEKHGLSDVKPHEKMEKGYLHPPPFSPLSARIFPATLPG